MQNMIAQQSKFSYIIPQLWVFGDTEQDTLVAAGQAKSLWEGHDFEMMYEQNIKQVMFYTSLPFGFYHIENNIETIDRHFYLDNENISRFLPVQGIFVVVVGQSSHILEEKDRISVSICTIPVLTLITFQFAPRQGAVNLFLNDMLDSYLSIGAKGRVMDLGRGYEKLTRIRKGRYIDFNLQKPICINPLDFTERCRRFGTKHLYCTDSIQCLRLCIYESTSQ